MKIIRNINILRKVIGKIKAKGKTVGFVATMGALHEGHLSLMRWARKENDILLVSIFVNPAQFGPEEDFKRYPRNLQRDSRFCAETGVDILFYPDIKQIYPQNYQTYVTVEGLSDCLCGKFRPGHFRGVATVVAKLFNIVQPDSAYFGQKDAQQASIIKRMVLDLNMPIRIRVMPTVRERDGLALSSRNVYLSREERKDALVLSRALALARRLIWQGKKNPKYIINNMRKIIKAKSNAKIDYISIVDLENLRPLVKINDKALVALAVWIGRTRLIDNIIVNAN